MKILQVNITYRIGSTGKIVADLDEVIKSSGNESYILCGYSHISRDNLYVMGKGKVSFAVRKDLLLSRMSGTMGYRYTNATKNAVEWIDQIKPDVIHIHNIHGDWINLELFFDYIKSRHIRVVWTLHDCWSFTGRCSHFELNNCYQWRDGCIKCRYKDIYPITYFFDKSCKMWQDKKKWFSDLNMAYIVTPSKWLAEHVKESYLKNYPLFVIPNGIDVEKYRPKERKSGNSKKIILGVASSWNRKKGFYEFLKLNEMIDHEKYKIILVGLNKKQLQMLPDSIEGIMRTNNEQELIGLYQKADVFINPSLEETLGMTTIEAMACGIPVITYNRTATPEPVGTNCGIVVQNNTPESLFEAMIQIMQSDINYKECCRNHVLRYYNKNLNYNRYMECYSRLADQ